MEFNRIASLCPLMAAFCNFHEFPAMAGCVAALVFCAFYIKDHAGFGVIHNNAFLTDAIDVDSILLMLIQYSGEVYGLLP